MADGISRREFARRAGVSEAAIRKALDSGRLTASPDGTLDPALVQSDWRRDRRSLAGAAAHPRTAEVRTVRAPSQDAAVTPAPDIGSPMSADEFADRVLGGVAVDRKTAEQFKEGAQALKGLLAAQREAGAIVDIEVAETVIFETFRGIRDSWLNWPSRVGPLIAADLGLEPERLVRVLTEHVNRHLRDLGEPEPDFNVEA